jgi:hypothetical protein
MSEKRENLTDSQTLLGWLESGCYDCFAGWNGVLRNTTKQTLSGDFGRCWHGETHQIAIQR